MIEFWFMCNAVGGGGSDSKGMDNLKTKVRYRKYKGQKPSQKATSLKSGTRDSQTPGYLKVSFQRFSRSASKGTVSFARPGQ